MKLFNKRENEKEYERRSSVSWGKYVTGDVWFNAHISNNMMHISQSLVKYNDTDTGEEIASIILPKDIVKKAILRDMVPEDALAKDFVLTVVPEGTEVHSVDVVSLKMYRDRLWELFEAKQGLADARQAFGWQSEAAKFAEKVVEAKQIMVDNVYAQLTGDWGADEKEDD